MPRDDHYELSYDEGKNRIMWRPIGLWESVHVVPSIKRDWDAALSRVGEGFTVLADMTDLVAGPRDVGELQKEVQGLVIDAGVRKVAVVVAREALTRVAGRARSAGTGIRELGREFADRESALAWLDE